MSVSTIGLSISAQPRDARASGTHFVLLVGALTLALTPLFLRAFAKPVAVKKSGSVSNETSEPARLSERVSVRAAGQGYPTINLSDGHELVTAYEGASELQQALKNDLAEPRSLAAADFDEDGVPDLVSGYEYQGRGIVSLLRGNVDSIYANSPEAQQRRATGTFTNAPFLSPARVFEAPASADFVGAGDFDGDSHWDVVVASRSSDKL